MFKRSLKWKLYKNIIFFSNGTEKKDGSTFLSCYHRFQKILLSEILQLLTLDTDLYNNSKESLTWNSIL